MKKCPNCNQYFGDENDFCPDDGTVLIAEGVVFQSSGDMPTQYVPRPQTSAATPAASPSNLLYLVIGILATALVGVGLYLLLSRDAENKAGAANISTTQPNTQAANTPPIATLANTVANEVLPSPSIPSLSPNGNWTGEIIYPSGSAFSAKAAFSDAGNRQVSGQILWTLLRTTNPQKSALRGSSATEFVRGTFDPATRTLTIEGYDTDDQSQRLIIRDKYRLTLTPDGRTFRGFSYGGKTRGQVTLQK